MTEPLFRDDAYLSVCEATVEAVNDRGGIVLDRTIFYATGGCQPGDTRSLERADGTRIVIGATVYGADKAEIVHVPASQDVLPEPGDKVVCHIDWDRRHRLMRMHTAMHLLSAVLPYPVTGGSVGEDVSRLDFDIPDAGLDKDEIAARINDLIARDEPVTMDWITDAELEANPGLVKTMSVKPPMGSGKVRLVQIGTGTDLQPCGGTHVKATGEIGAIEISKIEKKGRQNRRVRLKLTD